MFPAKKIFSFFLKYNVWYNYWYEKFQCFYIGSRPRLHHHYRGRRLSLWLNLLPQLQKTGQNTIYPSHNSLILNQSDPFSSWGIIQNSSISSASNILDSRSIGAAATACSTSGIKARSKDIDKVCKRSEKRAMILMDWKKLMLSVWNLIIWSFIFKILETK